MSRSHQNRRAFLGRTAALSLTAAFAPRLARAQDAQGESVMPTVLEQSEANGEPITLTPLDQRQGEFAEVNGARIFYQVSGEGDPMLLLHGFPLSGAMFDRNRDALGEQFQVITVDHRGYGMSEAPDVPDSIGVYAEDALAVMDELGIDQAIVGGHSMGGPIAMEMFQLAPDRFRGMALIDTNLAAATPAEAGLELGLAEMVDQGGVSAIVPRFLPFFLSGDTRMNHPELGQQLTAIMENASVDAALGGLQALATRSDYMSALSEVQVPALVVVGLEDALYPYELSMMIQEALPTSEMAVIAGAAHAANFEAPDRFNQAVMDWAAGLA